MKISTLIATALIMTAVWSSSQNLQAEERRA
jgi:hypothetical protein